MQEFMRFWPLSLLLQLSSALMLSLRSCSPPLLFLVPSPIMSSTIKYYSTIANRSRLHQRSTSFLQLIGVNRSHRLVSTLRQRPLSEFQNFETKQSSSREVCSFSLSSTSAVDSKHFERRGGFFFELSMGIGETNDDDLIAFQLKSAGWDATFSVVPSRT
jgi:hypothetical protein